MAFAVVNGMRADDPTEGVGHNGGTLGLRVNFFAVFLCLLVAIIGFKNASSGRRKMRPGWAEIAAFFR
jgi:hypothetical protein